MSAIDDARYDLRATRAELVDAARALRREAAHKALSVSSGLDPRHHAQSYPWLTLAAAFGAGVAIALREADRLAAVAAGAGATKAIEAAEQGLATVKATTAARLHRAPGEGTRADEDAAGNHVPVHMSPPGFRHQIENAITDLLDSGVTDLLDGLGIDRARTSREAVQGAT
jgi:hypothetical protein